MIELIERYRRTQRTLRLAGERHKRLTDRGDDPTGRALAIEAFNAARQAADAAGSDLAARLRLGGPQVYGGTLYRCDGNEVVESAVTVLDAPAAKPVVHCHLQRVTVGGKEVHRHWVAFLPDTPMEFQSSRSRTEAIGALLLEKASVEVVEVDLDAAPPSPVVAAEACVGVGAIDEA